MKRWLLGMLWAEFLLVVLMLDVVLFHIFEVEEPSLLLHAAALVLSMAVLVRSFSKAFLMKLNVESFLSVNPMTGLYNHRKTNVLLQGMLKEAANRRQEVGVLFMDLDDFAPINDNYGYDVGDLVLKHVVRILKDGVRPGDVLGRHGGDQFVVILPDTPPALALGMAAQLQERLSTEPFRFHEYEEALPITVSIGVAHFPQDASTAKELMQAAMASMQQAKRAGTAKIQRVPSFMQIEKYVSDSSAHLEMLIKTLKEKDTYTVQHSEDVARYALILAEALSLPEMMKRELQNAGIFHDIGKLLIPNEILKKPGRLDDEEYALMKQHVVFSHKILADHYTSETMKQAVICHHERFDGRGYPRGVAGMEIPLVGRIMAIADAFSAMTLDRSYRKSKSIEQGLAELRRCAGTQFDPELVEIFVGEMERRLRGERQLGEASGE
jgi:diguanylate cyclase (GGDEF)-like protein/putative nucleotidyltransferase with HDIG domain